ncbi:MAG: tetratricopeptide repeat-containing protein [Terrimicrobiaceae bacterium]
MQDKSGPPAPKTLDGVAAEVEGLLQRLESREAITSRELRGLWNQRLRPYWRLHPGIYRALSRRFLDQGDNYLTSEVAEEGEQFFGDDVALILTRALGAARSGAPQTAQALLNKKQTVLAEAEEAKSLLARTFKDLWKSSGEKHYLRESFDLYHLDYTTTKGDRTFPGVNAASMALFLGRDGEARTIAADVLALLRSRPDSSGYWDQATEAECLLLAGEIESARAAYARAGRGSGTPVPHAHLATTRAQARLVLAKLGFASSEFDNCFPLPGVIAFTGHRIDGVGRANPRFPEELAPVVKERIRQFIAEAGAGFGYSAAADGADVLFLECMQEAGLETFVHLPLAEEDFVRASVDKPGWIERFRAVTARATEYTCATRAGGGAGDFAYGNRLLLGAASQRARQLGSDLRLLAVWDGVPAESGSGGTGDYVALARQCGVEVSLIDLPGNDRVLPPPSPESVPDELLSILSLSLRPGEESEARLAKVVSGFQTIHCETGGVRVRLYFPTLATAAQCALGIHSQMGDMVAGALGLHSGPVSLRAHPLTGGKVGRGEHPALADDLAALTPAGLIYASSAFAALLGLERQSQVRSEFLGYRSLRADAGREAVFQILPPAYGT